MKRLIPPSAILALLLTVGCSNNSPAAPAPVTPPPVVIVPASFITPAGATLSLPGCAARAQLNAMFGIAVTACASFSGPLQNVGAGCASGLRGTLIVSNLGSQQVGSAQWSYANTVRPGEQIVFGGGTIDVPTSFQFTAQPTASWTNIACS